MIEPILERAATSAPIREIVETCRLRHNNIVVSGARGGSAPLLASVLRTELSRPILILTTSLDRAEALCDGIGFFGSSTRLFPAFETLPFEESEPAIHIASERSIALAELVRRDRHNTPPILIAPSDAFMTRVLPADRICNQIISIEWGSSYRIDDLAERLVAVGYRREAMVESPGEFSIRGTILDVYPCEGDAPWRLDFFGEELESIRKFDPATQRSAGTAADIESLSILPRACITPALEYLVKGGTLASCFDLLAEDTLVIMDGPARLAQRFDYFDGIVQRHWDEIHQATLGERSNFFLEHGLDPKKWVLSAEEAKAGLRRFQRLDWVDLAAEGDISERGAHGIHLGAQSFETVAPNFNSFIELIEEKRCAGFRVMVVCDNAGQMQRLDELFRERQIPAVQKSADGTAQAGGALAKPPIASAHDVALGIGDLQEGFILPSAKILLLTDREIFGRYKRRRVYRKAYSGKPVKDPTEIQRGDFVVHADHGIGQFEGIRRLAIEGRLTDFLEIIYQDGDKLLVPVDKLHLVQKYASAEGKTPSLDKLGKKAWHRRRTKSQEAIRKLAGELLELYARREAAEGHTYGPDTVWQQEFEASFLYRETPDQLRAIEEVKADMAQPKPMDRLVCGDVGYGKTEVAIRAAFKALIEQKQVALLVPTTLLAQQHYSTFRERLAGFPFRVAMLSRFVSPAEQKEITRDTQEGKVHLVIGTHRLLSKDIKFKDLGLLIVDEEQRFGVAQKERIKSFRASVDVLTLTATPIPRTLHMALAKLRDLSIIQTPPADRLPIKTRTIYFEREQIEEAILRELNRGGQVFFVHNRIESIDEVARNIREIVPQARIAVAHGQMDEDTLEQIMMDFIAGKFDILVSTTIIENGIDIPNVNTMIINRADAMGLAQLYQLRGRVGRDVRQAYAYLILPRGQPITDSAVKRLAALEEFTELGMGFSVAMRDMEIRGTGNLLGAEQHGAIADIGFEMYCKLLEEAVMELRGEPGAEPPYPTEVKWPADQWFSEDYIPIEAQRIRFYKELAAAREQEQLDYVREELLDRYGALPPEACNLINAFRVKVALARWHVDLVRLGADGEIRISSRQPNPGLGGVLADLGAGERWIRRIVCRNDGGMILYPADDEADPAQTLAALGDFAVALPAPVGCESSL